MKHPVLCLTILSVTALLARPDPLLAQSSPDADAIIQSLRPTPHDAVAPTRGIRPAKPAIVAPAEHTTAAEPSPDAPSPDASSLNTSSDGASSHGAPAVKLMVDFRTGSAELTPAAEHTLDQLGRALSSEALASYRFRIEGHTDTVGTPDANKALATKRADTVSGYLQKKFAIDAARLDPEGLGSAELLVPTPDQTPEPRNRVVRVVNIGS